MNKILHVVPSISKASGVMSFVMNLYNNIGRSNYQFDIMYIIDTPTTYEKEITALGGKTTFIKKPNLTSVYKFYRQVDKFLKEHAYEYSTIHLHEVLVGPIMLPLAHKYGIKNRIIHSHNSMPSEKPIRALRNNLLCLPIKRLSNVWLACSEKAGIFLYGNKDLKHVQIVNNAIDLKKYSYNSKVRHAIRDSYNISSNTLVIGHVGRFNDQKNHSHLINTIEALNHKHKDFILLLVGNGPNEEQIKQMVDNKKLTNKVRFLGIRSDINQILQAVDVFVLPSLFEGLPIAGIEAQAAGLPCVFSDAITKETEITDNVVFIPLTASHEIWAQAIIAQFTNISRKDTSEQMKKAGFDIDSLVNEMTKIYSS